MTKKTFLILQMCLIGSAFLITSSASAEACWKDTYGRGVGTVPGNCAASLTKSGLLCYEKCANGYSLIAGVCWNSYGRGAGYPWKFGDGLNLDGARKRCAKASPQGCEQYGEIIYPKCAPGFAPFGCCLCKSTGSGPTSYVVAPKTPTCGDEEYNAGLCYKPCKENYTGVGPLCWGKCPADKPVDCGAMCGTSIGDCAKTALSVPYAIVLAVYDIVKIVGTLGESIIMSEAEGLAEDAVIASVKAAAQKVAADVKKAYPNLKGDALKQQLLKAFQNDDSLDKLLAGKLVDMVLAPNDFDYTEFLTNLDPTGLSGAYESIKNQTRCPAS